MKLQQEIRTLQSRMNFSSKQLELQQWNYNKGLEHPRLND